MRTPCSSAKLHPAIPRASTNSFFLVPVQFSNLTKIFHKSIWRVDDSSRASLPIEELPTMREYLCGAAARFISLATQNPPAQNTARFISARGVILHRSTSIAAENCTDVHGAWNHSANEGHVRLRCSA